MGKCLVFAHPEHDPGDQLWRLSGDGASRNHLANLWALATPASDIWGPAAVEPPTRPRLGHAESRVFLSTTLGFPERVLAYADVEESETGGMFRFSLTPLSFSHIDSLPTNPSPTGLRSGVDT